MGQKVNPKIFRLDTYNRRWDSYYIEKNKEESTLLIYNDVKIKEFISRLFSSKGLLLHTCKIRYTSESISLIVSYYKVTNCCFILDQEEIVNLSNTIHLFFNKEKFSEGLKLFLKFRDLKLYVNKFYNFKPDLLLGVFRRYSKDNLFNELLEVLTVSLSVVHSSQLLVSFLTVKLKSIKTQNKIMFLCKLILSELIKKELINIRGIKLKVKGRFNKSARSKNKEIALGSIPLQTIKANIDYFQSCAYTSVGTFGVKLWICRS